MSLFGRVGGSVAFSIGTTLVLMFFVSRFPGMEIPFLYWVFGAVCPAIISFAVSLKLARQTEHIRDLQRQREDFLQLLSHDMRAPQASIIALLDHAPGSCSPPLAQQIRTYANRTLKLADDMVQLSRAQYLQFKPEVLNIADIGHDAIDAIVPLAQARHITVDRAIDDDEILIRGEASLLARAFVNLLENAVKFSSDASNIRFAISRGFRDKAELAICSISDHGTGIPREQMALLYQRFEGGRSGPVGSARGAGLGLAFVKTVVARHGGTIQCDSLVGRGTTFRIEFPMRGFHPQNGTAL